MRIPIDTKSPTPLYCQIADWLKDNILNGSLPADSRLPSTRLLADELGVSRITVKNAYALIESDGLIITREGSGTYVEPPLSTRLSRDDMGNKKWPLWQIQQVDDLASSLTNFQPVPPTQGMISFTGVGDPAQYPLKDFLKTMQDVLRRDGTDALEYGRFGGGYAPLQRTITRVLANQGIQASPDQVLITSGSQQGLALVCHQLLKEGDVVLVEKPTYNLALELFRSLNLKIIDVPTDENGMQVEHIEPLLQQHHPRLIYTIPNFQNPGGTCMNVARRRLLLTLGERYNIPILEDDFVGDLRFEGRALPAIKALDANGQVIYVGTFSKILMPGIRIGYLLVDGPILSVLTHQKVVTDLTTSPLMQRVLDLYVTVGRYQSHLRRSTRVYRQRRDAIVIALNCFIPEASFSVPHGGLFLWLKLPAGVSSQALLSKAMAEGMEFAPGTRFFANPKEGEGYLRLNFAAIPQEKIEPGILRLAKALSLM